MTPDLTVHDVAAQLQVSPKTIYRLAHRLRGYKVGRGWRFRQAGVDAFRKPVPEPQQQQARPVRVPSKRNVTLPGWHDFD